MPRFKHMFGCGIFLFACGTAIAGKASADLSGLEEDTRALVAKERARQMMFKSKGEALQQNQDGSGSGSSQNDVVKGPSGLDSRRPIVKPGGVSGGCNMDIGNSTGGVGGSKPKPVIITGPVIQNCK